MSKLSVEQNLLKNKKHQQTKQTLKKENTFKNSSWIVSLFQNYVNKHVCTELSMEINHKA